MKKVLLTLAVVLGTLSLMAQQPERQVLHNQFSDYVGFRKNQEVKFEKPQIEKKDGKVIITMSEEQFNRMNQMRMGQRFGNQLSGRPGFGRPEFQHTNFRRPQICEKCKRKIKSHKKKNFKKD
jgi:hypothetical protein